MKQQIFTFQLMILSLLGTLSSFAQISKVNYQLKFNKETSLFDCYLVVDKGSAFTKKERIQFNAQITFVVPAESEMAIKEYYMPLQDNQNFNGANPAKWYMTNSVSKPKALPNSNIVSVTPELSPTALYNDMREGDKVKLFSFSINPLPTCAEGVRLYDNTVDPASVADGMKGGDFSNGFTLGGTRQKYSGNLPFINTALPTGNTPSVKPVFENENISLFSGDWQNAATYSWSGPNGFKSNDKNPVISNAKANQAGKYTLTVVSENGCRAVETVNVDVNAIESLEKDETVLTGNISTDLVKYSANNIVSATVYPNPASNFINISINGKKGADVSAQIYDNNGRLVMKNVINQKMEGKSIEKLIPLKLQAGLYTVKVSVDGQESDHRFICIE